MRGWPPREIPGAAGAYSQMGIRAIVGRPRARTLRGVAKGRHCERRQAVDRPGGRRDLVHNHREPGRSGFDGSPEVITELLGLQPTRSGRAGEPSYNVMGKPRGRTNRVSFWSLHSQAGDRVSVGEHVANLLEQVRGSREQFARLPPKARVTVRCTVIPNGDLPPVRARAQSVARSRRDRGGVHAGHHQCEWAGVVSSPSCFLQG